MKKVLSVFAAMLVVLMLAACGSTASSTPPASSAAPVQSQAEGEGSIRGTVVDATMNTLTIQVPNGSEYSFGTEGVPVDGSDGLLLGDEVTVHYTGTFNDAEQEQDVTVTGITVEVSANSPGSVPAAPTGDVKSLQGVIDQYDGGDTMMVADATGVDYLFSLDGADLHVGEEGFKEGDEVIVYYYGDLVEGPELQDVTVGEVKKADQ